MRKGSPSSRSESGKPTGDETENRKRKSRRKPAVAAEPSVLTSEQRADADSALAELEENLLRMLTTSEAANMFSAYIDLCKSLPENPAAQKLIQLWELFIKNASAGDNLNESDLVAKLQRTDAILAAIEDILGQLDPQDLSDRALLGLLESKGVFISMMREFIKTQVEKNKPPVSDLKV